MYDPTFPLCLVVLYDSVMNVTSLDKIIRGQYLVSNQILKKTDSFIYILHTVTLPITYCMLVSGYIWDSPIKMELFYWNYITYDNNMH